MRSFAKRSNHALLLLGSNWFIYLTYLHLKHINILTYQYLMHSYRKNAKVSRHEPVAVKLTTVVFLRVWKCRSF